jgi:hypothetical protein
MSSTPNPLEKSAELVADHYQKTFELTYEFWQQRNRLFLLLLAAISISIFFSLESIQTQGAILKGLAALLGKDIDTYINALQGSLTLQFLQSFLVVVIFFLMFNLYHRTIGILRNYLYLGGLEDELRYLLKLQNDTIAFSREGDFYWKTRRDIDQSGKVEFQDKIAGFGQWFAKWVYILLLSSLLAGFIWIRIKADISYLTTHLQPTESNIAWWILIVDVIMLLLTTLYFVSYAAASVRLDKEEEFPDPKSDQKSQKQHQRQTMITRN